MAKRKLPPALRENSSRMKSGAQLKTKGSKPNVTPKNISKRKGGKRGK